MGHEAPIREAGRGLHSSPFDATYPFILDEADRMLVGGKRIRGKADILRACEESASDMEGVKTTFSRFKVITTDDSVVIDSRAEYVDDDGESSHVASCEIYEFVDGDIAAITSYMVEVPPVHQAPRDPPSEMPASVARFSKTGVIRRDTRGK